MDLHSQRFTRSSRQARCQTPGSGSLTKIRHRNSESGHAVSNWRRSNVLSMASFEADLHLHTRENCREPEASGHSGQVDTYIRSHGSAICCPLPGRKHWFGSVSGKYQGAIFSNDLNTDVVHGAPGSYNPFFTGM